LKNKALILFILFLSVIAIAFFLGRNQQGPGKTAVGLEAPDIELKDAHENRIKLSELKGSVVLVNFWASWCQPCLDEMPSIEGLFRNLSGNSKFKLISVLYRDERDRAVSYMKKGGYTFSVYIDPDGSAARRFRVTGVPESFIIDKKGILRDKVMGPFEWDSPSVIATLSDLTNE